MGIVTQPSGFWGREPEFGNPHGVTTPGTGTRFEVTNHHLRLFHRGGRDSIGGSPRLGTPFEGATNHSKMIPSGAHDPLHLWGRDPIDGSTSLGTHRGSRLILRWRLVIQRRFQDGGRDPIGGSRPRSRYLRWRMAAGDAVDPSAGAVAELDQRRRLHDEGRRLQQRRRRRDADVDADAAGAPRPATCDVNPFFF